MVGCYDDRTMKTLDWLKFVGAYAAAVLATAAATYLVGRETLGAPLRSAFPLLNGAFIATWFAARTNGPANPMSWRLALRLMAALAVLGVSATVLVGVTVGWRSGMSDPLEFTVPLSLLYPSMFVWISRRWARAAALASDSLA
jgi:hypothetical protein